MYYFASDMHLGLGSREESLARERLFVEWLEMVAGDAEGIFIVGDMFDFWHEYKRVIPKGFSRLLGTLSRLTDRGVPIHFFTGNHDMWAYDYLAAECGVQVHREAKVVELDGHRVYISHGDDITAQTRCGTRLMNGLFRSRIVRLLFSRLIHPDDAMRFGQSWSNHSRKSKSIAHTFLGEADPMVAFARRYIEKDPSIDLFVFGHNHCAEIHPLSGKTSAVFLGEWLLNPTYAILSPNGIALHRV
jgi:UDP-2,3-diacylglucosamine hydrolase